MEAHAEFLRMKSGDDELVDALKEDWRGAPITERQRSMLAFAEKLTLAPSEMSAADAEGLRVAGLNDAEILALVLVAGFFNLATRIADALGVELDPEFERSTHEYVELRERLSGSG